MSVDVKVRDDRKRRPAREGEICTFSRFKPPTGAAISQDSRTPLALLIGIPVPCCWTERARGCEQMGSVDGTCESVFLDHPALPRRKAAGLIGSLSTRDYLSLSGLMSYSTRGSTLEGLKLSHVY